MNREIFFDENSTIIISNQVFILKQKGSYASWAIGFIGISVGIILTILSIVEFDTHFLMFIVVGSLFPTIAYGISSRLKVFFNSSNSFTRSIFFFSLEIYKGTITDFLENKLWIIEESLLVQASVCTIFFISV